MEVNPLYNTLDDLQARTDALRGTFDYANRKDRLAEVELELGEPDIWNDPDRAQELGRERSSLEAVVKTIEDLDSGVADCRELLEMAVEENDADTVAEVESEIANLEGQLAKLEFRRMFSGEMDQNNAFLDIQSGSGGTEAQDWAEMLLRMYLRWADDKGFKAELVECSAGEVAGIKKVLLCRLLASMPLAGCEQRSVFIAWCVNRPMIPATVATPLSLLCLSRRRSMTILISRSIHRMCAPIPIARPVPVAST